MSGCNSDHLNVQKNKCINELEKIFLEIPEVNIRTNLRHQHEQIRLMITRVLRPHNDNQDPYDDTTISAKIPDLDVSQTKALKVINSAFEKVKEADLLDLFVNGNLVWESVVEGYDEGISSVEPTITKRLRDKLGTVKNSNDMFMVFSRFNALFVPPQIQGVIRQYQTKLIQLGKNDIESLQEKLNGQHIESEFDRLSYLKKTESQVDELMVQVVARNGL